MVAIKQGLQDEGFEVSMVKLCRWFGVARRRVYYRPTKAPALVDTALAAPIQALIEEDPLFGHRTVAGLLGMNKNRVQRSFQLKGRQVRKGAVGRRPHVEALPSAAQAPDERWATELCRIWGGPDGWLILALGDRLPHPQTAGLAALAQRRGQHRSGGPGAGVACIPKSTLYAAKSTRDARFSSCGAHTHAIAVCERRRTISDRRKLVREFTLSRQSKRLTMSIQRKAPRPPNAGPQMADLAKLAGVSKSTVSRALADSPLISERTRRRIQALASESGYQVNPLARSLRSQQSRVIAVAIPLVHEREPHLSDPFMMTMIALLADEIGNRGYNMLLSKVAAHEDGWARRLLHPGQADGAILIGQSYEHASINEAARAGLAIVAWGTQLKGQRYPSVGTDNRMGGRLATEHLIMHGRRRIGFLGDERLPEVGHRFEGYRAAMREHGQRRDPALHVRSAFSANEAYVAAGALVANAPDLDGVVAASDVIAMNAIRALVESGRRVPQDVSVVGFDDIFLAQYVQPALTTVRQDLAQGAGALVDTVIAAILGEPTVSLTLQPTLVVRESA